MDLMHTLSQGSENFLFYVSRSGHIMRKVSQGDEYTGFMIDENGIIHKRLIIPYKPFELPFSIFQIVPRSVPYTSNLVLPAANLPIEDLQDSKISSQLQIQGLSNDSENISIQDKLPIGEIQSPNLPTTSQPATVSSDSNINNQQLDESNFHNTVSKTLVEDSQTKVATSTLKPTKNSNNKSLIWSLIKIAISTFIVTFFFLYWVSNETELKMDIETKDSLYQPETKKEKKISKLNLNKNKVLGKVNFSQDKSYEVVNKVYAAKSMYLNKEAYAAFKKMYSSARKDGIRLKILSGARSFNHQKEIWERKWSNNQELTPVARTKKILEFSSMPGTSRHHWGTEVDLNDLNNSHFLKEPGKSVYRWLKSNARKFGFYQVYTNKRAYNRKGYNEEKWHWSYLPTANEYLDYYNQHITYDDITGFKGANYAHDVYVIEHYVNGITNPLR